MEGGREGGVEGEGGSEEWRGEGGRGWREGEGGREEWRRGEGGWREGKGGSEEWKVGKKHMTEMHKNVWF